MTADPQDQKSGRRWPWLLGWLLLTVYFVTPPRDVYDQTLDKSNYATYARFFAQGAQWGSDVIPMTGPFGFILYGQTYSGDAFWPRLFGDLALKAVFALLLLHLFRRAGPGAVRWLWLAAVVFVVPMVDDLFHDYAILLAGLCILADFGGRPRRWAWLAAGLLGFLALFKGTHLFTTAVTLGAVVLLGLIERRPRAWLTLVVHYAVSLAAFWLLARQDLRHLPAYLRDTLELSSGYNAIMGIDETPLFFGVGLFLAGLLAAILGWTVWHVQRTARTLIALLLLAGFTFIKWKHGFLRADGHVYIFYTSASVLAATYGFCGFTGLFATPPPLARGRRRVLIGLMTVTVVVSIIASVEFRLASLIVYVTRVPSQLQANARYLVRPNRVRAKLEQELDAVRLDQQVPQIQNEIEHGSVDFFGFEQGVLLLNGLNYHPRPMGGGSFSVLSPRLQRINEAFVDDPARAPDWQVFKLQTFDNRLPSADDPLTLLAVLQWYSPILMQRDYILLQRHALNGPRPQPVRLKTATIEAGVPFEVPDVGPDKILLFTLEAPLSWYGRIRSFLYRPPNLTLHVTTDRAARGYDYVLRPLLVQNPTILSPFLDDNLDVLRLYSKDRGNRVHAIRLDAAPGFAGHGFSVTFFAVPRPEPGEADVEELLTYRQFSLYNREPVSLVAQETGIREINKEPITLVHAPGSITWDLRPNDQQVIFSYGLYPAAYLAGNTDGVEFNVEVLWPPRDGRILFKHMLRPYTYLPDRGMHRARVFLPPYQPGAQLRIRTHPGPDNNGAYDQSYITRLQIKSGPPLAAGSNAVTFDPEQFNGLGVVPADGRLPKEAVASVEGRPVFLIHAPSELVLNVPAGSHQMACEIGLLPGTYSGDGNTDGVDFTILTLLPGGTRTKLWARFVDPRHRTGDRGPQFISVDLPLLPAGAQLVITTGPGPHNDRSWDQSYIASVKFR